MSVELKKVHPVIKRLLKQHRDNQESELQFEGSNGSDGSDRSDGYEQHHEGWFGPHKKCHCCGNKPSQWSSEYHVALCRHCHKIALDLFSEGAAIR